MIKTLSNMSKNLFISSSLLSTSSWSVCSVLGALGVTRWEKILDPSANGRHHDHTHSFTHLHLGARNLGQYTYEHVFEDRRKQKNQEETHMATKRTWKT